MARRTLPKTRFTDTYIDALAGEDKQYEITEPGRTGLRLRVSPKGAKSFAWVVKHNGKYRRINLGRYPETSLKQARQNLEAERTRHESGIAPGVEIDAPRTIAQLCEVFYTKRILPHRTRPDAVRQVLDHDIIPTIGAKRLQAVTTPVLAGVVDGMVIRGAAAHAAKATAILKQMFAFAEARGFITSNPAASLRKKDLGVVESQRDRWLTLDEINRVWHALDNLPRVSAQIRIGIKLLLLTGVRSDELRTARWAHFDLECDNPVWRIPKENTKTKVAWTVPLSDLAVALFVALKKEAGESQWAMPGLDPKAPIGDKAMARAVKRLLERKDQDGNPRLPMPAWSPHDLRRTLRTHLSKLNVPPHICEKCLNHSLGRIASIYDKHDYLAERREALQRWAERVQRVIDGDSTIVELQA